MQNVKLAGTVREWRGGYGFIQRDDNGGSLFVHQSDIEMDGYRQLAVGERVEFEIVEGERGPKATRVQVQTP